MSEFCFFILRASNIKWVYISYNTGLVYYTWFILVPTDSKAFYLIHYYISKQSVCSKVKAVIIYLISKKCLPNVFFLIVK